MRAAPWPFPRSAGRPSALNQRENLGDFLVKGILIRLVQIE
jgi:hypothetical protein